LHPEFAARLPAIQPRDLPIGHEFSQSAIACTLRFPAPTSWRARSRRTNRPAGRSRARRSRSPEAGRSCGASGPAHRGDQAHGATEIVRPGESPLRRVVSEDRDFDVREEAFHVQLRGRAPPPPAPARRSRPRRARRAWSRAVLERLAIRNGGQPLEVGGRGQGAAN